MTYVFLGSYSEVLGAGIKLTKKGERVELPPEIAEQTKEHGGLPCIPAEAFDAIPAGPDQFRKALEILHDLREGVTNAGTE